MSALIVTHKRLWAHAGEECAFPGCSQTLFVPVESGEGEETIVGKECHIVARADDGPRGPSSLSSKESERWRYLIDDRDGYANLILLCGVHHDVIDADVAEYTIERLLGMKRDHERAVKATRGSERERQDQIEFRYAGIVDQWAAKIGLNRWDARMSSLVSDGMIERRVLDDLEATRFWLLNRIWPRTQPTLESAFLNFRLVEQDLNRVALLFSTERDGVIDVDRVYKEVDFGRASEENVKFLRERSVYYEALAADLAIELTRAVNLVCERVREGLWPDYRVDEGYSTIGLGLDMSLTYSTLRPIYDLDPPDTPYPGLIEFTVLRADRDYAVGAGPPPEGAGLPS
jgi:hypothetical protein